MIKKISTLLLISILTMTATTANAATVANSTPLYDGQLKVDITINAPGSGYWITDAYNNYQVTDGGSHASTSKGGYARAYAYSATARIKGVATSIMQ